MTQQTLQQRLQRFFLKETTSNKLKANNLNHFLDFEKKMIFTESEQIFNIELQDQVKIIQLDNPKTVSYKNLDNYHSPEFA